MTEVLDLWPRMLARCVVCDPGGARWKEIQICPSIGAHALETLACARGGVHHRSTGANAPQPQPRCAHSFFDFTNTHGQIHGGFIRGCSVVYAGLTNNYTSTYLQFLQFRGAIVVV